MTLTCIGGPCDGKSFEWKGCDTLMARVSVRHEIQPQIYRFAIYDVAKDESGKPTHFRFVTDK